MALNKANTSLGIKIVIVFLIIAFVTSFISLSGIFTDDPAAPGGQAGQTDELTRLNSQFAPGVQALTAQLQSDPTSYTVLVNLGNAYFGWADAVSQAAQNNPQIQGADQPLWVASRDAYRRAVEIERESPVMIDYAIVNHYTGFSEQAAELAEEVIENDPEFAPAWFNVGIFYEALGRNDDAIAAYRRYLELDPEGRNGNPEFANERLTALTTGDNGTDGFTTTPTAPTTTTP